MRPDMLSTQLGGIANLALLAPVKAGFVEASSGFTYAKRLEVLLTTLNAMRLASREAAVFSSPFPDSIGRFGLLHSFRYALVPPRVGSRGEAQSGGLNPGIWRLALNVTFDGGWEPYIRVIYRDLGSLLDAIFCNIEGYPLARGCTFDDYTRWVREHEIPGGLFYTESSMTAKDQRYLSNVQSLQVQADDAEAARKLRVEHALPEPDDIMSALQAFKRRSREEQVEIVRLNLKALNGLYQLRPFYPENATKDDATLLRFSQQALKEFAALLRSGLPVDPAFQAAKEWILQPPRKEAAGRARPVPSQRRQGGIESSYEGTTHGALILLRITDLKAARETIRKLPITDSTNTAQALVNLPGYCNVALTVAGLKKLRLPPEQLDAFAQEFLEGMEARAGLLGDVRYNHPTRWRRPKLAASAASIDFSAVHLVVQVRIADRARSSHDLHPELAAFADRFGAGSGLAVMSIEAMRSWPTTDNITREHFGFRDGFSQPVIVPGPVPPKPLAGWSDAVLDGEIFLGHPSDREGGVTPPAPNALMDNGTFLAVRKISQDIDALGRVLSTAADQCVPREAGESEEQHQSRREGFKLDLQARMMGRTVNGSNPIKPNAPHTDNNYDYSSDGKGMACPFHAHARRANPRTRMPMPRIIRRGMSYGPRHADDPHAERGLYFMAYCASIAEQFEMIQRWITGGNSSGVASSNTDPFLGVWPPGEKRFFEFLEGDTVRRIDLGDKPFTRLEWGVYLFVPNVDWLKSGMPVPVSRNAPRPLAGEIPDLSLEGWRQLIEDPAQRDNTWKRIRQEQEPVATAYGILMARPQQAIDALRDDKLSVCGYGARFKQSIGLGYLGLDDPEHARQSAKVNELIAAVSRAQAHEAAFRIGSAVVGKFPKSPSLDHPDSDEINVDIVELSKRVLSQACEKFFGIPALDPADFLSVARHIFWPHPADDETQRSIDAGQRIRAAVRGAVDKGLATQLSKDIMAGVVAKGTPPDADLQQRTLAGVMQGMVPTVHLNFIRIVSGLVKAATQPTAGAQESLFDLQADLLARIDASTPYADIAEILTDPVIARMRKEPVPELVWRIPKGADGTKDEGQTVIGLAGALQDESCDHRLMFGGVYKPRTAEDKALEAPHACPGYEMALGLLTGMLATILRAGTLRPTPSPTSLTIIRARG